MQKNVERSGKDFATPVTFILSYFMHYVNYALDSFQARLHKQTLIIFGYQAAKKLLESTHTNYLSIPASPNYEITFFTQRLLLDDQLKISVYDYHFYGNFDELRNLIFVPQLGAFEVIDQAHPKPPRKQKTDDLSTEDRRLRDETYNSSILAEYLQPSQPVHHLHDMSMAETVPLPSILQLDVRSDDMHVVPDHDLLDEMERQFHHES
ncbi:hypothetical protein RvY_04054 [Ramazzottius varieornatus]|uniref:Uncharacterized protein n=1 Tax=Ramazzottius varieornatus TaxID=947166 RepID=A0A1D1UQ77_RAMVA|nr:hypothetical protein RvY_04054 [Ramazzottius varieornatus]